jgi:hypothetical protein
MDAPALREKVNHELDTMTVTELEWILKYIENVKSNRLPDDYDPDNDPAIGFLSGSTDLASNAKQILRDEITSRSGWTQKKE